MKVAALYVQTGGAYYGLPDVDPWDESRDARTYSGPHPVVAHPPCQRWGRYWGGGPSASYRRHKGDDQGCFASALFAVRTFGGVLEHPQASSAWQWYGLRTPPFKGGWVPADSYGGYTCCVEQGHYGHLARKATWLYANLAHYPELTWGPSQADPRYKMDEGFHSPEERRRAQRTGACRRLSKNQRAATPIPFRDLLLSLAQEQGL